MENPKIIIMAGKIIFYRPLPVIFLHDEIFTKKKRKELKLY